MTKAVIKIIPSVAPFSTLCVQRTAADRGKNYIGFWPPHYALHIMHLEVSPNFQYFWLFCFGKYGGWTDFILMFRWSTEVQPMMSWKMLLVNKCGNRFVHNRVAISFYMGRQSLYWVVVGFQTSFNRYRGDSICEYYKIFFGFVWMCVWCLLAFKYPQMETFHLKSVILVDIFYCILLFLDIRAVPSVGRQSRVF